MTQHFIWTFSYVAYRASQSLVGIKIAWYQFILFFSFFPQVGSLVIFMYQDVTYYMYESHDKYSDPIQEPVVGGRVGVWVFGRVREGRGGGGRVCCCMLILRKAMTSPCRIQETLISPC